MLPILFLLLTVGVIIFLFSVISERKTRLAEAQANAESQARLRAQNRAADEAAARAKLEEELRAETEERTRLQATRDSEIVEVATATGTCDCCGKDSIGANNLVRIDSGQMFCSD